MVNIVLALIISLWEICQLNLCERMISTILKAHAHPRTFARVFSHAKNRHLSFFTNQKATFKDCKTTFYRLQRFWIFGREELRKIKKRNG